MGRPSHARTLGAWMNGQHVGDWTFTPTGDSFQYARSWMNSPARRSLSLSLPMPLDEVSIKAERVHHFFDNLLPDSDAIRRRIQARFTASTQDAFDLLSAIGRDCVGAIQLLPPGETPEGIGRIDVTPLDDARIEQWLIQTVTPSTSIAGAHDAEEGDFRISIAGAQEKTALTWHEARWCKPHGATPTTHMFKLPLGLVGNRRADMSTSVENEWLCARIMNAFGVPTAQGEIARFGSQKVLIVERFDRRLSEDGTHWLRLPQEDFCQAAGVPSSAKYESDGGPGIPSIANILSRSQRAQEDLGTFFKAQFLFFLMAATDGHAKNFSIHLMPGDEYRLTPLYDVLSAWPIAGTGRNQVPRQRLKMAMALRGKSKHHTLLEIFPRHFIQTASKAGFPGMQACMEEILDTLPAVLDQLASTQLPRDFPPALFDAITQGMRNMRDRCLDRARDNSTHD